MTIDDQTPTSDQTAGGNDGHSSASDNSRAGSVSPSATHTTELVVFDFDETVVNCNSDTYINVLAPGGAIPEQLWNNFLDDNDWTAYMQQVFAYLGNAGVRENDYKRCRATMPFVDSVKRLLQNLGEGVNDGINGGKRFEVIVISDANSFFINYTLQYHKLDHIVK